MNKNLRVTNSGDTAKVFIFGDIGGWDGIQARDLLSELEAITATKLELHLNSYGGDVFEGTTIFNALKDHPATVTTYVDGVAASAASFIAMAGDRIIMSRGSQMMIHDAMGACIGNAAEMRKFEALLDRTSNNIAELYAVRAGGTTEQWRERMRAETWYNAAEAVKAGLADEASGADEAGPQDKLRSQHSAVLNKFKYQDREEAPAPDISNNGAGTDADAATPNETEPTFEVDLSALRDALKEAFK